MRTMAMNGCKTLREVPRREGVCDLGSSRGVLEKASVLIVEDDPDLRAFLHFLMEGEGLEVLTAEDGAEALFSLTQFQPDLILTDLAMPQVDGLELIKRVK